jgi:integrase
MSKKRAAKRVKGQGSVFLDPPSPFWHISYWNGWRQVRQSARTLDREEALAVLQRKLGEIATGRAAGPERIRISALLQLLLEDYRRRDHADLYQAELRVAKHLHPVFGDVRAAEFSTKKLNLYIEARKDAGAANATINRELAILRRAFKLGYKHDPQLVYRLPVIEALKESNVREGFLETDCYRRILDALGDEIKPVFVVAYHLGMRMGELLSLKRDWIDLRQGMIYVQGQVTKNRKPKTAPIYGDMAAWLEMTISRGNVQSPKCPWLFSREGKRVKDFRRDWQRACEVAGVPGLLFHDLRRTAVRNMIRAGVPEKIAMQIAGYKTPSMLWRYNIIDERDIREAGKRTERYLRENESQHAGTPTEYLRAKPS